MQQSNRLKNHFDLANSRYTQLKNIDDIIASKFNDFNLRNYAEPGFTKILNIGIGNGLELITLRKIYSEDRIKIIGIDISPTSIDLTKNLLSKHSIDPCQVELVTCNAKSLPFPNKYVDIIFMNSLLHEVVSYSKNWGEAWESAIHEAYRVLTPGGLLYIEDFTADTTDSSRAYNDGATAYPLPDALFFYLPWSAYRLRIHCMGVYRWS